MTVRILTLLIFTFILSACSGGKSSVPVKLKLFQGSMITALNLSGGVVVVGKSENDEDSFRFAVADSDQNISLDLKKGKWEFMAIGWTGTTGPFTGENKCAYSGVVDLKDTEASVSLNLSQARCLTPFANNVFSETSLQNSAGKFFKLQPVICYNSTLNAVNCPVGTNLSKFLSYKTFIKADLKGTVKGSLPSMNSACHLISSAGSQLMPAFPATQDVDLGLEIVLFSAANCSGDQYAFNFGDSLLNYSSTISRAAYSANVGPEFLNLFLDPGAGTQNANNVLIFSGAAATNAVATSVAFDPLASGVVDICFSETNNGGTCSPWINSTVSPQAFSLSGGDGNKTVYMFARSADLVAYAVGQDTIVFDSTIPTVGTAGTYVSDYTAGTVNLNWGSWGDLSPVTYDVQICADGACTTSCTTIVTAHTSTSFNWTAGGTDGAKYVCVSATDSLGHVSTYANTGSFTYDTTAPSGHSIAVNSSATYSTSLTLSYNAPATGANYLCLNEANNVGTCTWNAYSSSGPLTLSPGEGNRSVYAFFKDLAGNTVSASTSIIVDTSAPTIPGAAALNTYYTTTPIAVNWGASVDANLSHYGYKVCASNDCLTSCGTESSTVGTVASDNISLGVSEGVNYLCLRAEDLAGNSSTFSSVGSFTYDTSAPTAGSFQLNASAAYTNNTNVSWAAGSHSGSPSFYCVSNTNATGSCSWNALAGSGAHTLLAGDGTKSVYFFVKDAAGNISSSISDNIDLDMTAPSPMSISLPIGNIQIEDKSVSVQYSGGGDTNFSNYEVKLCDNSLCNGVVHATFNTGAISFTITKSSAWNLNEVNFVMVNAVDLAGNISSAVTGTITRKIKKRAKEISLGYNHTCALTTNGEVKCWGQNTNGQLGIGNTIAIGVNAGEMGNNLVSANIPHPVKKVASGASYTCALTANGLIYCWGNNISGKLGLENTVQQVSPQLVNIGTGLKAIDIAVSATHTCALTIDGDIKCWGQNTSGELGIGTTATIGDGPGEMSDNLLAVNLDPLYKAIKVSATNSSTCALLSNHKIKCWGNVGLIAQDLTSGVVGVASPTEVSALTPINFGADYATDIQSGMDFTCALFANGKVKCWGANIKGQLGIGGANSNYYGTSTYPVSTIPYVNFGAGFATKIAVNDQVACAILDDGNAKCWGENFYGVIGQENVSATYPDASAVTPLNLGTNQFIRSMAVSSESACAILGDGTLKCWGVTARLGMGTTGSGITINYGDHAGEMGDALPLLDLGNASEIDVMKMTTGEEHACALLYNGRMKCWGSNAYGQIGLNAVGGNLGVAPAEMGDNLSYLDLGTPKYIKDVEAGGAGTYHTCALMINGDLKCFGRNHSGQLGIGNNSGNNSLIGDQVGEVSSALGAISFLGDKIKAMATGPVHTCALSSEGKVWCFGDNSTGKLGVDTTTSHLYPFAEVAGLPLAIQIAVGGDHSCALLEDGQAKCWGSNSLGQLGINSTVAYGFGPSANSVAAGAYVSLGTSYRVTKISAGVMSTCVLLHDGNVKCVGSNSFGQLGADISTGAVYGTGSPTLASQPVVFFESTQPLSKAIDVKTGGESACVLKPDGLMKCWGNNSDGQLGQNVNTPYQGAGSYLMNTINNIFTGPNYTEQISIGRNVCRINALGQPLCWGANSAGQVGQGTNFPDYGTAGTFVPVSPIDL